jgi:hypothetical protein
LILFPAIETRIFQREGAKARRREDAKESAVDGLGLGRLVVIHVVIGEVSANRRAVAPSRGKIDSTAGHRLIFRREDAKAWGMVADHPKDGCSRDDRITQETR